MSITFSLCHPSAITTVMRWYTLFFLVLFKFSMLCDTVSINFENKIPTRCIFDKNLAFAEAFFNVSIYIVWYAMYIQRDIKRDNNKRFGQLSLCCCWYCFCFVFLCHVYISFYHQFGYVYIYKIHLTFLPRQMAF